MSRSAWLISLLTAAFIGLLAVLSPVQAGDVGDGTLATDSSGREFFFHAADSFWWRNGVPYTRTLYTHTEPGYYTACYNSCGAYAQLYHAGSSYDYYKYDVANYTPPAIAVNPVIPYQPGWKDKVIEAVKARDDQNTYLQTLKLLGLPLPPDAGLASPLYNRYGVNSYSLNSAGVNANTRWGYNSSYDQEVSVADAVKLYDQSNLGILFQALGRSVDRSQQLSGDAVAGLTDVTKLNVAGNTQAANTIAAAIAAAAILRAARPPNVTQTIQTQTGVQTQTIPGATTPPVAPDPNWTPLGPTTPSSAPLAPPIPAMPQATDPVFQVVSQLRCGACHSGPSPKGHFNIADYAAMTPKEKAERVWPRIRSDALPEKRMPRNQDGSPGQPLTADEQALFFRQ